MQSVYTVAVICTLATMVVAQVSEDLSAEKTHYDDDGEVDAEKRARFAFAKRSPYRHFAFAKRAYPYGFAFAKRDYYSSFA
ncbi:hypothetical protein KIN20_004111 [Parelaphostrongylus tenuis]|uniref:Uncharacterized protein n=1 Tax=Parelaphostrongylus tenuis TaxID=148309 RepID=A0AAD5M2K2_PARTN|nr:hypothetical protein KIN20_004111 [Parelaphostrongylus tenuis]